MEEKERLEFSLGLRMQEQLPFFWFCGIINNRNFWRSSADVFLNCLERRVASATRHHQKNII
jgi:hypothetical protein